MTESTDSVSVGEGEPTPTKYGKCLHCGGTIRLEEETKRWVHYQDGKRDCPPGIFTATPRRERRVRG